VGGILVVWDATGLMMILGFYTPLLALVDSYSLYLVCLFIVIWAVGSYIIACVC